MSKNYRQIKMKHNSDNDECSIRYQYNDLILLMTEKFTECPDIKLRKVAIGEAKEGCFIYISGLIDTDLIQRDFIDPILEMEYRELLEAERLKRLPVTQIAFPCDIDSLLRDVLEGCVVFLGEGMNCAISCDIKKFDKRAIDEPVVEKNVRGPHEGFIEVIGTNMTMLRRRVKSTNLKFMLLKLGTTTNQTVVIAYIEGIANASILKTLYEKVSGITLDGFISAGIIEQFITDHPNSPFPQYQSTERVDKAVAALLEGKFIVMLDGTPTVLVAPVSFWAFFAATDDYSTNWMFGTFLGIIRVANGLTAVFLPALYIALLSFHYYAVPLNLLIPLAESRARVPFPPVVEALIMELTLETMREASIRLPTYIGTSIGVVGGLVIGQAAVEAGIVSNLMIIVVAVTAIASFVIPNYDMGLAIRFIRFLVMIASATFGIIGIIVCSSLIIGHLVTLESLGQPYFQPVIPFKLKDLKDTIIRLPVQFLYKRPDIAQPRDKRRGTENDR